MLDYLLEELRKKHGFTKEQEDALIEEMKEQNPVNQLQQENEQLKKRLESAEEALLFLMDLGMM